TMKLDKLPEIAFVEFKADDGTLQDVRIFLATPGASDPSLDIDGMGMGIVGRLRVAGKDIAQANLSLTESGIAIDGEVLLHKLGPLKIHNAEIDAQASLDELPSFHLNADIELLGIEERIKIVFDREEMGFELDTDLGQVFSSQILANASIADPTNPDFEVRLAFQGDFLDFVLGEIEKELDKALGAYKKDAEAARAALKKAEDDIDAEEKKVQAAFEKAEEDIKKAEADVDKVEDEVKKLQNTINNVKSKIDDKEHDLKNTDFWRVDKQIKLALEIVGLSIELGGVYAAKATAIAALEAVKGSMELVPVLFQPALLASNAVFEAAKGAVTVADLTVQASEYALKGIEDAIAEYRKSFHFEEAIFDGSLQALLGNKPIVMETKFVAFGKNVDLDLTFTPASPEDLGKAVGTLMKKLGKEIVKDIEHAFFGGGSSGGSGSSSGGGSFTPPDWSGQGAIDQSIPLKGAKYINQKSKKCLVLSKGNLAFGDCKGVHDSQLFRFSPDGDLVAVGSDAASPLCVTARGPKAGAAVEATACADSALQKWRFANGQLSTASGFCAMPPNGGLQLVGCDEKASAQLWTSEAIADLKALSDQPQDTLFSVSFRTPDGKTCIDGADGLILEYQCDGEDYQVFDLRSDGQLRSGFDCVLAKHKKKGGTLYLGKCEDADVKWVWNKSHMKVKGSKLCMMRNPPNRLQLMPVTLGACADAESQWTLEPTNVDPKGRILPAFAMIRTEGLDDAGRERITREAQAMGRLGDHPHIVPVLDLGQEDVNGVSQPYIVSQYMAGGTAKELLAEADGDLPLERTLRLAMDVCRGLEAAHGDNIVHRDLSLGNVWLAEDGTAKIGDFGLAVSLDRTRLTQAGMMVGTATYMPPEQALSGAVTPQSDLYSLGVMLYELVTGRPPFIGDDPTAVISQHINTPP
ncbi:MAG: protein kinase, partial [Chloroflexi bacterium]|nr:protein kinase [Chloroflexota bacterium]